MAETKTFPLQQQHLWTRDPKTRAMPKDVGPFRVPWALAELAYREYQRRYSNDQTMERLAERQGFVIDEFAELLLGFFEHDKKGRS